MNIFVMDDIRYKPLAWAVAFFLVAKLLQLVLILGYAWLLPKVRAAHLVQAVTIHAPCHCFLPLFGVRSVSTAVIVFTIGVVLEIVGKYLGALAMSWVKARNPKTVFTPPKRSATQSRRPRRSSSWSLAWYAAGFPRCMPCTEGCTAIAYVVKTEDEIGLHE